MISNHLIAEALCIGEASDETYKQVFKKQELIELWENHCIYKVGTDGKLVDPAASYDDEVYNALDRYGYWDDK